MLGSNKHFVLYLYQKQLLVFVGKQMSACKIQLVCKIISHEIKFYSLRTSGWW
jgi:hypothetical protein